jgi:hypothetical protein
MDPVFPETGDFQIGVAKVYFRLPFKFDIDKFDTDLD